MHALTITLESSSMHPIESPLLDNSNICNMAYASALLLVPWGTRDLIEHMSPSWSQMQIPMPEGHRLPLEKSSNFILTNSWAGGNHFTFFLSIAVATFYWGIDPKGIIDLFPLFHYFSVTSREEKIAFH